MSKPLNVSNHFDTVRQLDYYYGLVKRQLLQYQSATTGLFPAISLEEREGSVRDSIYCAAAIWSLYQAYRRIDDDQGKSYELGQSAVKCMRGVLQCWIKQASKIELFKKNQCNAYSLHCKFDLITGDVIYSENYPHLQIDVVSLYLLYLVEMISSGLQIIYTQDEVAFIQNLVYYVERAYRTPDYGIWERGTKYNNGVPEIQASSIGIAKSALEAINGCNLFGEQGASWSVIYVDIDAHNRNRSIFDTMLPRESSSKEVDAALLCTISYPAFATHQQNIISETMKNIVLKLKGRFGFKRFLRDGFKTELEDPERKFYTEGETKGFENIECEWPLFFIYMIIDGVFKNLPDQVKEYKGLLTSTIKVDQFGDPVVPMYYYVPLKDIEVERSKPGSVTRLPSYNSGTGRGLFLWAQAMYVVSQLLTDGLLHVNELDPIRRYQPSHSRPRKVGRYSVFQGTATDLVVQIILIAESMRLQAMMATYGIQTQTPHQVEPVQIWSSSQLVKVYENLGVNSKLNLKGRPRRPIGALGTSKVYRICGMTVLCYPIVFEVSDFYLYRDMALLIDDIKTELHFVGHNWRLSGRPTVCLLIKEEHMRDPYFKEIIDLMAMLKRGYCKGTKVRIGRLQNLISSSCIEHLDFMNDCDPSEMNVTFFKEVEHDYIGYQSLTDVPRVTTYSDSTSKITSLKTDTSLENLIDQFQNASDLKVCCQLIDVLRQKQGDDYIINGMTIKNHIKNLYYLAGNRHCWDVVRFCSSLLKHTVDSISPFITTVLVYGKQLTVGVIGHEETVIDKPMTPAEIHSVMYNKVQPYSTIQAVLQQEVVLYCGRLIATEPQVFKGIIKIRIGWLLEAIKFYLKKKEVDSRPLECRSPYELRQLIYKILSIKKWASEDILSVFERRQLEGCLCRVPSKFYTQVWDVLNRTPRGFCAGGKVFHQQPVLSNMGKTELSFALLIEETINHISQPEYRQIIVELLCILSTILSRNPELTFQTQLNLDHLVSEALYMFKKDNSQNSQKSIEGFFDAPNSVTTGFLARAVVNNVLQGFTVLSVSEPHQEVQDHCKIF